MSTTLTVLHVLMSSGNDAMGDKLLMTSSSPSSLMTSSTTSSLVASLDPILVDFWSAFPCPPPWNKGLLFSANWTSCVSQTVGERIKWFLADRCNIPHNQTHVIPGTDDTDSGGDRGFGGYGEREGGEACDLACKVLVGLFCFLFVVAVVVTGVVVLFRRRSKRKDQRGTQQTSGGGGDRGRSQYAGIHYASASVINREGERPLPPCPQDAGLPRTLHAYVYNPRDTDHPSHPSPDHRFHLHLCPMNRRAAYRAMEHNNTASGDSPDTDNPHVYDYISDTDSVRWRGSVRGEGHEHTYCTCECSDGSSMAAEYGNGSTPRQSEGYHSDHDQVRQPHEISKPNPRYPDKRVLVVPGMGKALPGGVGGLNNNNDNSLVLGLREGVVVDSGRAREELVPVQRPPFDPRGHPGVPVDSRHHPAFPFNNRTQPGFPVDNRTQPAFAVDNRTQSRRAQPSFPVDSRIQPHIPMDSRIPATFPSRGEVFVNNGFHDSSPADSRVRHGPPVDTVGPSSDRLTFVNAPPGGLGEGVRGVPPSEHDYEYPENPLSEEDLRANALALHPQYFADYFDGGTSSV
ncbi:hypothetical protein V1264_018121 [Littorina saxatilis]|uniref:Uncharacterized protein n=1 Tax=Littorina saxatilis TaxID=31220 RepID=A0AAN9BDN1_9CAEN